MADLFIRQLTHDNEEFERKWSSIFSCLCDLFLEFEAKKLDPNIFKVKTLDALVDYVIADSSKTIEPINTKFIFIDQVVELCSNEPIPSLNELVRILRRILDLPNIFNSLYLALVKAIHFKFELCQQLASKPSTELIQSILKSLQKHSFTNGKTNLESQNAWEEFLFHHMFAWSMSATNTLTDERIMLAMRCDFQEIFKYAVRMSSQSNVWEKVSESLTKFSTLLFDASDDPTDALTIIQSDNSSISSDYLSTLSKSYKNNVEQFKKHFTQILNILEQLILMNRFWDASNFIEDTIDVYIHTAVDIDALLIMLVRICPQVNEKHRDDFCHRIISSLSYTLKDVKCSKKLAARYFDLILVILDLYVIEAPKCALNLLEKQEFYPWKDLAPRFAHMIRSCIGYETVVKEDTGQLLDSLQDILELIVKRAKVHKIIFQVTHNEAQQALRRWSLPPNDSKSTIWPRQVYKMGKIMIYLIDRQQVTIELCAQLVQGLQKRVVASEEDTDCIMECFFINLSIGIAKYIEQLTSLSGSFHHQLALFIQSALEQPLQRESGEMSFEKEMAKNIWFVIGHCLKSETEIIHYDLCLKKIHSLAYDENEEDFFEWWSTFWDKIYQKKPETMNNYAEEFFNDFINRKRIELFPMVKVLCLERPEISHLRLNELINGIFCDDQNYSLCLAHIILIIVQKHAELISSVQVERLLTLIQNRPNSSVDLPLLFQILCNIANAQPHLFHQHRNQLLSFVRTQQYVEAFDCLQQYFVASTIVGNEATAHECLTILINLLKEHKKLKSDIRTRIFHTCELIGVIYKTALQAKRTDLMAYKSYAECRLLLDYIDGKMLSADNKEAIKRTQNEIKQMEKLIVKTDTDLKKVSNTVKHQEINVINLNTRVNTMDTRVNDVDERLHVQQREIERIDAKTLCYVPNQWGKQVCQLLNQRVDNDWRLLGKRFGYSVSELRHWSLQSDPSMALLNEWFMTHKADEATYGLVKMLDEIGRKDVSKIIREAVAAADEFIPDDIPFEIKRLPPVFLSYQWGVQKAVIGLKGHLEEAGYACWMDTGQMGGGDKLFAKIDAGIRGAKVVICCMNSAYAQSDNCSREVHLAISTGKSLIPLQMEKQTWPPEGALGPIMSEYLFIRFYDRKSNNPNYWPEDKFFELLGQIRYHVAPNLDMISSRYENWFLPNTNNFIFPQSTASNTNTNISNVAVHPQIMISYQWDRQNDIITLYKKLVEIGYLCWLDIYQMGGGDSLFEKIDTGIRHAKCIIACVTPKYTKSINCRREMSLSDALSKPIVPLLLEDIGTWPPSGPMALVFTDKTYIDCRHIDPNIAQNNISSSKVFDQLLTRLEQAIPEIKIDKNHKLPNNKQQTTNSTNVSQSSTCCLL